MKPKKDFTEYAGFIDINQWDETYQTIVATDWANIGADAFEEEQAKKRLLINALKNEAAMTNEQIESLEYFLFVDSILEEGGNPMNCVDRFKQAESMKQFLVKNEVIAGILKGFNNKTFDKITIILRHNVYLKSLWTGNTFIKQKIELGTKIQKDLNATIHYLTPFISGIIENFFHTDPITHNITYKNLPEIIRKPITDSVTPLAKAHTLATAYRGLINNELKKYRYKESELTRREEWSIIIKELYQILKTEMLKTHGVPSEKNSKKTIELEHGADKAIHNLIAQLLAVTYPWCWGENMLSLDKATKIVKDRLYPRKGKA